MTKVLIVDDEQGIREMLEIYLRREGYETRCAGTGEDALQLCSNNKFDVIISDIKMPGIDGMELLEKVKLSSPETVFIMITAYASFETAKKSMEEEAYDYITKPFDVEEIKRKIDDALEKKREKSSETPSPDGDISDPDLSLGMAGNSPQMRKVFSIIPKAASSKSTVLIVGESGTGKELVARAIHRSSPRKNSPFVTINCGGIPENLLESELFGYKKGAFTGALKDKKGLMESADGGVLFLDEVGELPLSLQVKFLRVVQDKTFMPVGGNDEVKVDVHFICATNKSLETMVAERRFREDLYYRLNVINITLPALRERREDIPVLVNHFLKKYSREMGKKVTEISSYGMECLIKHNFPGNIRELENIIERGIALSETSIMLPDSISIPSHGLHGYQDGSLDFSIQPEGIKLDEVMAANEKGYITEALNLSGGSLTGAAKLLGISLRSIRYRIEKLKINEKIIR